MNLGIGFLPKKYYENEPSTGGYNFFINEGIQYAINIGEMYYPKCTEQQLALFTESLAPFPLYFLFEQNNKDFIEELKQDLYDEQLSFKIFHQSKISTYFMITVSNHQELLRLIPIMIWQHNYNMSSLWSNRKNAFTIENKTWNMNRANGKYASIEETICLNFNEPTTIFWFGHDFIGTDIFSNEERFANLDGIQKWIPPFIKTEIIEFG
ncbi:hypothetical protein ABE042_17505 [Viridibacillus arvi]|uniref:hypothetical protein n=1 Tax=Viridibacillus arvi TaxID=263475 RepID=UPI003D271BED